MRAVVSSDEPALHGVLVPPPDKSISHRALIFGALASGVSRVENLSQGLDVSAAASMLRAFGVLVQKEGSQTIIESSGILGLQEPSQVLDLANSGTGVRLGIGAATLVPGMTVFTGDASLRTRPMGRVLDPLRALGAKVAGRRGGSLLPVVVQGGGLHGGLIELSVASAQVKSALILAALGIDGEVEIVEPNLSRPHTEELLHTTGISFADDIDEAGVHRVRLRGPNAPLPFVMTVPGDPSAAAFGAVGAACVPGSSLEIAGMYQGSTRLGFLQVLRAMGADIVDSGRGLMITGARLEATEIKGSVIPSVIDELPVLCVAGALATGTTVISDAHELRVKESDRIETTAALLRAFGVEVVVKADGMEIVGGLRPGALQGTHRSVDAHMDHRIAMSAAVLGILAGGTTEIDGVETVATSYPRFFEDLADLSHAHITVMEA